MNITEILIEEFSLRPFQIENTVKLFEEGATVPFIARYRKEMTGSLDEIAIRNVLHKYTYYKELDERRGSILAEIDSQGKLTDELKRKIIETKSKTELEDLYLPYKPKRLTRGKKASDAGLGPLAEFIKSLDNRSVSVEDEASKFLNEETKKAGFDTIDKVIKGALDIIAEDISDMAEIRKELRGIALSKGVICSYVRKDFKDKKTKYNMYYDYKEPVKSAVSHRILAMFRGEKEKVLRLELEMPVESAISFIEGKVIIHKDSNSVGYLKATVKDAYERLLSTATETEIRKLIREDAEAEAFKVFGENLRNLLLAPPAGSRPVLGIDPGFRTGCKMIAVDKTGKLLDNTAIYPTEPRKDIDTAREKALEFIHKYGISLIAIGNGTASRETEKFIKSEVLPNVKGEKPLCVIVSEAGASVYSASEMAAKEFPDYDLTVRGAVSIARRLQDPLAELVKIDPKSIGVGQYQHDVNQTKLKASLSEVVESCVNSVGVNVNLASAELLKYVAGLNKTIAENIVKYRDSNGEFKSRDEIKSVTGLGEKTFEQSAGFLRVAGSQNPLDNSSVHPERYSFVVEMARKLSVDIKELAGNRKLLSSIDKNKLVSDEIGLPTIEDIISELEKPGRDPRAEFKYAEFDETVNTVSDLEVGMKLEGTVTNVTNFGAFVDIGVHQDGLVHISQIANKFVSDPSTVVKVGQIVNVRVLEVDKELNRISLSMKSESDSYTGIKSVHKVRKKKDTHATLDDLRKKLSGASKRDKKIKTAKPQINIKNLTR